MLGRLNPRAGERDPVGKKRPQRRGCIWRNRPIRIARQDQHPSRPEKVARIFAASKRCQSNKISLTAIIREKQTATNYFRMWKRSLLPRTERRSVNVVEVDKATNWLHGGCSHLGCTTGCGKRRSAQASSCSGHRNLELRKRPCRAVAIAWCVMEIRRGRIRASRSLVRSRSCGQISFT
jgi:hypothetical protein